MKEELKQLLAEKRLYDSLQPNEKISYYENYANNIYNPSYFNYVENKPSITTIKIYNGLGKQFFNKTIIPNTEKLKTITIKSIKKNVVYLAIEEVAKAYESFISEFNSLTKIRNTNNTVLANKDFNMSLAKDLSINKSYSDPTKEYETYQFKVKKQFIEDFCKLENNRINMYNIDTFLNNLITFYNNNQSLLLFSTFVKSINCSIYSTSLVIDVEKTLNSYLYKKQYLDDANFSIFCQTANKYNFFIDFNNPTRLVYDQSAKKDSVKFYKDNYIYANTKDFELMKSIISKIYDDFYVRYPTEFVKINDKITKINRQIRFIIEPLKLRKLFFYMSLKENDIKLTQLEFDKELNNFYYFTNNVDDKKMLQYIEKVIETLSGRNETSDSYKITF